MLRAERAVDEHLQLEAEPVPSTAAALLQVHAEQLALAQRSTSPGVHQGGKKSWAVCVLGARGQGGAAPMLDVRGAACSSHQHPHFMGLSAVLKFAASSCCEEPTSAANQLFPW